MNVLMFSEDFHPITSGGSFADTNVATHAAKEGHDITVLTFRSGDLGREDEHQGVEIKRPIRPLFIDEETNSPLNIVGRVLGVVALFIVGLAYLVRGDYDVIYSTNHFFHPIARPLSAIFSKPLISFVAYTPSLNPDNRRWTNPMFLFEQINFRLFMGGIVYCRNTVSRDEVKKCNPESDVRLAHGVVDGQSVRETAAESSPHDWLEQRIDADPDARIIAFVGRFSELKRPELAVAALADLPNAELVMAGDGDRREAVESAIGKHGVEDRAHLLGLVSHEMAIRTLLASDHLVLTSEVEAYPTVVFEALACSCSVAATPVGILPHLDIGDGRLQTAPADELSSALKDLPRRGAHLDEEVLQQFSIERFAQEITATFEEANQ